MRQQRSLALNHWYNSWNIYFIPWKLPIWSKFQDINTATYINVEFLKVDDEKLYDCFNSSSLGQKGFHFADFIFKCLSMNEMFCIPIRISLKFVPGGPIGNKSALVQVMAWHQTVGGGGGRDYKMRPKQNGQHLSKIFKLMSLNIHIYIYWSQISLIFFPKGPIKNKPGLIQILACHQTNSW